MVLRIGAAAGVCAALFCLTPLTAEDAEGPQLPPVPAADPVAPAPADPAPPAPEPPTPTPAPEVALPSDSYDIVVLKAHREQLFGKIIMEDPKFIIFEAKTDSAAGRMKIDREKILTFTYDLHRQSEGLADDDVTGWFAIALKAYQAGYWSLAFDWMTKVAAKLPADPQGDLRNVYRYAGRAADYQDKYDAALKNYTEHLKLNPGDKGVETRTQEIRDYLGVVDPKDAGNKRKWPNGWEDMTVYHWKTETWSGNNTGSVTDQIVPHGIEGDDHLMAVSFQAGQFDKLVVSTTPQKPFNFTGGKAFKMSVHFKGIPKDAKTPVRPVMIALAFKSPGSGWMETEAQQVTSTDDQWVQLSFNLEGDKTFKTAETQWAFQSALLRPDQIQDVHILVHNRQLAGTVYFNDMGVE
ncbi:MAG TPA: hypothetical protein VL860_01600 [Planctomycetota bacterium]|nr:hypothetical protein [Planctomycetota bacterium]